MVLVTARALPSTDMPSESTVGGLASLITTARPAWPLTAPLATLILPPCLTQVTDFRSRPERSLPSTFTSVEPPVLTCEPPAAVAGADPPLSSEQPTSTAAAAASPITPATTRFIDLPFVVRRPDGVRRGLSQDRPDRYRSQTLSGSAGTVRRRCGHSRLPNDGRGWRGATF